MSFIGSFAQGDWKRGLISMLPAGGAIHDLATGRTTVGELGKQAAIEGGIALATMGVGAVAGAAASGLAKAAAGAAQAGTKIGLVGSKVATVASKGLSMVSKAMNPGQYTGGAAGTEKGYMGTLPDLDAANAALKATSSGSSLAQKIGAKVPEKAQLGIPGAANAGTPGTLPGNTIKYSLPVSGGTKLQMIGGKLRAKASNIKTNAGKITGQDVVQGALSVGSGVMGAKQANAANEVSKQSLLFQKQTYKEQQAEIEKNKAQRRADALTDYNAASLFGSQLYGSESNSTLLTNYHTNNGLGNQGSFSLLNASISTSKRTDLT